MMAKSGARLGRGLGSLISGGSDSTTTSNSKSRNAAKARAKSKEKPSKITPSPKQVQVLKSDELIELDLNDISPNPYQPRKQVDMNSIDELASSIKSEGLLQPIAVRKVGDSYELVAGERRWRAHQQLGKKRILARVLDATDLSSASLSLIENLQREGLNPVEEALGYHSLVNDFNLTQAKVAERVGKSRVYVTNLLRLLKLHEDLRTLLADGKLNIGHAKVLLGVDDLDAQLKLGLRAVSEGWTVRHCEREVEAYLNPSAGISRRSVNPFAGIASKAESALGRSVRIKGEASGSGQITISFKDPVDLQKLLDSLGI